MIFQEIKVNIQRNFYISCQNVAIFPPESLKSSDFRKNISPSFYAYKIVAVHRRKISGGAKYLKQQQQKPTLEGLKEEKGGWKRRGAGWS